MSIIEKYIAKEGSQRGFLQGKNSSANKPCQLAPRFKVSLTFVRNLLRHARQTGKVEAKRRGGYMEPKIATEHKRCSPSIERRTTGMPYSRSETISYIGFQNVSKY